MEPTASGVGPRSLVALHWLLVAGACRQAPVSLYHHWLVAKQTGQRYWRALDIVSTQVLWVLLVLYILRSTSVAEASK